jgi:hypothetical protein
MWRVYRQENGLEDGTETLPPTDTTGTTVCAFDDAAIRYPRRQLRELTRGEMFSLLATRSIFPRAFRFPSSGTRASIDRKRNETSHVFHLCGNAFAKCLG